MLEFYAIESPLAQPRNAIGGQIIASVIGVAIGKLFLLHDNFEDIKWWGGALSCAAATSLMALTKTVHPPAGATALLAVVDGGLIKIGWFLIPVVMLGCGLMLAVALLINNIERRFPIYWWTPEDLRQVRPMFLRRQSSSKTEAGTATGAAASSNRAVQPSGEEETKEDRDDTDIEANNNEVLAEEAREDARHAGQVIIKPGQVIVPEHMFLTQEEKQLLETLSKRL